MLLLRLSGWIIQYISNSRLVNTALWSSLLHWCDLVFDPWVAACRSWRYSYIFCFLGLLSLLEAVRSGDMWLSSLLVVSKRRIDSFVNFLWNNSWRETSEATAYILLNGLHGVWASNIDLPLSRELQPGFQVLSTRHDLQGLIACPLGKVKNVGVHHLIWMVLHALPRCPKLTILIVALSCLTQEIHITCWRWLGINRMRRCREHWLVTTTDGTPSLHDCPGLLPS